MSILILENFQKDFNSSFLNTTLNEKIIIPTSQIPSFSIIVNILSAFFYFIYTICYMRVVYFYRNPNSIIFYKITSELIVSFHYILIYFSHLFNKNAYQTITYYSSIISVPSVFLCYYFNCCIAHNIYETFFSLNKCFEKRRLKYITLSIFCIVISLFMAIIFYNNDVEENVVDYIRSKYSNVSSLISKEEYLISVSYFKYYFTIKFIVLFNIIGIFMMIYILRKVYLVLKETWIMKEYIVNIQEDKKKLMLSFVNRNVFFIIFFLISFMPNNIMSLYICLFSTEDTFHSIQYWNQIILSFLLLLSFLVLSRDPCIGKYLKYYLLHILCKKDISKLLKKIDGVQYQNIYDIKTSKSNIKKGNNFQSYKEFYNEDFLIDGLKSVALIEEDEKRIEKSQGNLYKNINSKSKVFSKDNKYTNKEFNEDDYFNENSNQNDFSKRMNMKSKTILNIDPIIPKNENITYNNQIINENLNKIKSNSTLVTNNNKEEDKLKLRKTKSRKSQNTISSTENLYLKNRSFSHFNFLNEKEESDYNNSKENDKERIRNSLSVLDDDDYEITKYHNIANENTDKVYGIFYSLKEFKNKYLLNSDFDNNTNIFSVSPIETIFNIENKLNKQEKSSHSMSFQFKSISIESYLSFLFERIRRIYNFHIDDLLSSLDPDKNTDSVKFYSGGRSGIPIISTWDEKLIIKAITYEEKCEYMKLAKEYYLKVESKETLLCPILGIYLIKINSNLSKYIILMKNMSYIDGLKKIYSFDLKGSSVDRSTLDTNTLLQIRNDENIRKKYSNLIFKDEDLKFLNVDLNFIDSEKNRFVNSIEKDCLLLKDFNITDYSLLLCVYDLKGYLNEMTFLNNGNTKENSYKNIKEKIEYLNRLKEGNFIFISENNLYLFQICIIDYLTEYDYHKMGEVLAKSLKIFFFRGKDNNISAQNPYNYSSRLIKYSRNLVGYV